jgi:hypothetical protein
VSGASFRSGLNRKMEMQYFTRGPDIGGDFKAIKQKNKLMMVLSRLVYTSQLTEHILFSILKIQLFLYFLTKRWGWGQKHSFALHSPTFKVSDLVSKYRRVKEISEKYVIFFFYQLFKILNHK